MIVVQDEDKNILTVNTTLSKALKELKIAEYPSNWLYIKLKEAGLRNPVQWKTYFVSRW